MKNAQEVVAKTIEFLDSYNDFYKRISGNRYDSYEEYITKGKFVDEERLVRPEFLRDFTQKILGFTTGTISYQDPDNPSGDKPDTVPFDTRVHPFLFETKGSDSDDLRAHFNQIKRYIDAYKVTWGIIFNLRECIVFSTPTDFPHIDLHFSFIDLYHRFKAYHRKETKALLEYDNTKAFISFVNRFSKKEVTQADKIQKIAEAKNWTGLETLDPDVLTTEIREMVRVLHDDVKRKRHEIGKILGFNPERKKKIALEIDDIAKDIEPKKPKREITDKVFNNFLEAKPGTLDDQAVDNYLYRVAYFTMTKILLVRAWEDIGFIDQTLFNGGFEEWYEKFNHEIDRVLRQAFHFAGERYSWLFNIENNYTWYSPSDDALVKVLYRFSNFNLSLLSTDVLGYVYEEYLDITDRKNKGQYYTPREIIRFIWDRVGFTNDGSFFRLEGGKRNPCLIYDPATGSGGFLVEAVRRIRQEAHYNKNDFRDLLEIFSAIVSGIYGSEIQAFPYYITEVNLLLQFTPVVKDMLDTNSAYFRRDWALNVIQQDSLKLHNATQPTLTGLEEKFKSKDEVYERDQNHDIIHLEGLKLHTYEFIKYHQDFDYVCANPPYIGEKGHKELFRYTVENFPYWKQFYQGKMDYLYFFIELGLSKIRDGGKLGFITTAYWPTADGASNLRKYILDTAKIKEVIFFGDVKLFDYAKGQHNMVFILERCDVKKAREKNKIKIVTVKKEIKGKTVRERLRRLVDHINRNIGKKHYSDEYIDVFISPIVQGGLAGGAWSFSYTSEIDGVLQKVQKAGKKLGDLCDINCGVQSGADKVTKTNIKLIPDEIIRKKNIKPGDGIFVLTSEELKQLDLPSNELEIVKPFSKNSDIFKYFVNFEGRSKFLIYTTGKTDIKRYPAIETYLETYKPILESKRESKEGKLPWYSLHWSRDKSIFERPKIINPQRSNQNTFAYTEKPLYTSVDVYFTTLKKTTKENLKYICGVLNSKLIKVWLKNRGKRKGDAFELYYAPLSQVPIRCANFQDKYEKEVHNTIVNLVEKITNLKENLSRYEKFYPNISLLNLETAENLSHVELVNVVKQFSSKTLFSLRTDPRLKLELQKVKDFFLNKIDTRGVFQPDLSGLLRLQLVSKNRQTISITGPEDLLEYLAEVLPLYQGKGWEEIKNKVLIPKDFNELERKKRKTEKEVASLINRISNLQKEIDKIVYRLYEINKEEQEVVKHSLGA